MPFKPLYCICGPIKIKQRMILAIMLHFGFLNAYHLRVVLNIAITEMQGNKTDDEAKIDECPNLHYTPVKSSIKKYHWSSEQESFILYAFYIGYFISHIPGGYICDLFGARHVMGGCILGAAIINLFYPICIEYGGHISAIVLRIFIGVCQGPIFPAVSEFIQCWVPKSERSFFGGVVYSGPNLGTVTGGILTGLMIQTTNSWQFPFYVWSVLAIAWYVVYLFTVFSSPKTHPFITEEEIAYLEEHAHKKHKMKTPWLQILISIPVWALICGQFGHNMLYFTLLTNLPTYFKEILKMDVRSNALFTAIPFGLVWFTGMLCSYLADVVINKEYLSVINVRRIWTLLSTILPSITLLLVPLVGCNRVAAVILLTVSIMLLGPFWSGLKINVNDITLNHAGVVMAVVSGLGSTPGVLGPLMVGEITSDTSLKSWGIVFIVMTTVAVTASIIFAVFAKGERQTWDIADPTDQETVESFV